MSYNPRTEHALLPKQKNGTKISETEIKEKGNS
jgi:hypothetical protein